MVRVTTENGCVFNEPPYTEEEIKELERQSAMFSVRTSGDLGRSDDRSRSVASSLPVDQSGFGSR